MAVNYDFYLAALLYDLRLLPGFFPGEWVRRNASLFSLYTPVEELCAYLDNGGGDSVLAKASKVAGGGEPSNQGGGGRLPALKSVFSRLTLGSAPQQLPGAYYSQAVLDLTNCFPAGERVQVETKKVVAGLDEDVALVAAAPPKGIAALLTTLDTILKRHLWCVPADSSPGQDVSLYDRLKITAAVAYCLQAGSEEKEPYLLLTADFSGIQTYIFAVARTSVKGVAKRLRARSFLVDAMIQTLAYHICDVTEAPYGNILMLSGGKFYLLLPNTAEVRGRVEALAEETAANLYRRFAGEIAVNMAWLPLGDEGLQKDYSGTITELSQRLRREKNRAFRTVLTGEEGWREEAFILADDLANKHACHSCGKALIAVGRDVCDQCRLQEQLGGRLATAKTLWLSREGGEYQLWPGYWLSFEQEETKGPLVRVEQLNRWELPANMTGYPLAVRLMANHLPKEGMEPLSFSELAEQAVGSKRLAILKADVDTLGYLFADGMRERDKHYGTIARITALSRLLEQFFSGYISYLLEEEYPAVYSVFSGGDDLFLIGPWDQMPALALRIAQAFRRFAGDNPCVTLSAALCLADPKANLALLAESSEEELKRVKNSAPVALYPGKQGRNGVSFLGDVFSWEDFAAQVENIKLLLPESQYVNTNILRRIQIYSEMYRRFLVDHDVLGLMFEPLFYYDRTRNYKNLPEEKLRNFFRYAEGLPKNAANYKELNRNLYFAQTVITCILNQTKEVRTNANI